MSLDLRPFWRIEKGLLVGLRTGALKAEGRGRPAQISSDWLNYVRETTKISQEVRTPS